MHAQLQSIYSFHALNLLLLPIPSQDNDRYENEISVSFLPACVMTTFMTRYNINNIVHVIHDQIIL